MVTNANGTTRSFHYVNCCCVMFVGASYIIMYLCKYFLGNVTVLSLEAGTFSRRFLGSLGLSLGKKGL